MMAMKQNHDFDVSRVVRGINWLQIMNGERGSKDYTEV